MDFETAVERVLALRDDRDWAQFHNPKDLAISINLEAAELLEVFQWSGADVEVADKRGRIEEELADVVIYCIDLADRIGASIPEIISRKIDADERKYPVEKARGTSRKYTEL